MLAQERAEGSSRSMYIHSITAITSGMDARKQMIVSTGTYYTEP